MALNFCPFETEPGNPNQFKKIDINKKEDVRYKLGYELRMIKRTSKPRTWEEIEELLDNGDYLEKCVQVGADQKLKDKYNDAEEHYLVVGTNEESNQARQKLFWDFVEKHEKILKGEKPEEVQVTKAKGRTAESDFADTTTSTDTLVKGGGKYYLRCVEKDGTYVFSLESKNGENTGDVMYALPCCPHCHHVLPKGWLNERYKKFMCIGMLGDSESGKTTMLYSMIANKFSAFREPGIPWRFSHTTRKDEEPLFDQIAEAAKDMCRDHGTCPVRTERDRWIEPIFMEVKHPQSGNEFILGVYDASGENQDYGQERNEQQIHGCFDAIINLLQPEALSCYHAPEPEEVRVDMQALEEHLSNIEQQGEMQRNADEGGSRKRISELSQFVRRQQPEDENLIDPFAFLENYMNQVNDDVTAKQHVSFTIVKCDKLQRGLNPVDGAENIDPAIQNIIPQEPISLEEGFLDPEARKLRQDAFRELMKKYMPYGDYFIDDLFEMAFKSCSYHCVSALGCDTIPLSANQNKLVDRYRPICITEPLLACVEEWYAEQQWGND